MTSTDCRKSGTKVLFEYQCLGDIIIQSVKIDSEDSCYAKCKLSLRASFSTITGKEAIISQDVLIDKMWFAGISAIAIVIMGTAIVIMTSKILKRKRDKDFEGSKWIYIAFDCNVKHYTL